MEDIKAGLESLIDSCKKHSIKSIATPPIGCGNSGLNWSDFKPLIENACTEIPDT